MQKYNVTGMSCAACSARVEKAVSKVEGVKVCNVNLLTNSMLIEGTATPEEVKEAVKKAGYGATLQNEKEDVNLNEDFLEDTETPKIKRRLISSLVFLLVLMYFSMGYTMFNFKLPSFLATNPLAIAIIQMLLAIIIMIINNKFFINGFKGAINKSPNMDTLVALGSSASFIYSIYQVLAMTNSYVTSDITGANKYLHELYFESAAMILVLITLGKMLEARSKGKTTNALKSLIKLTPKTAIILQDGKEVEIEASKIKKEDIFIVKPGTTIPADGIVIDGFSAVNESALTGESIPVDKEVGDNVSCATINQSGYLKCKATNVGEDTMLSQIIKMVSDSSATKAPIAKIADKVSYVFVPVVILIAVITTFAWLILGKEFGFALARGISVLVISCPCALGLATPVAIMVGNGIGAKNGILFKNSITLEQTGKVEIVALDKTGTITTGETVVTDILPAENVTEEQAMQLAFSLEEKSEHPLAKAIVKKAKELKIPKEEAKDFKTLPGNGIVATLNGKEIFAGNLKFISSKITISNEIKEKAESFAKEGKTPLFFGKENNLVCIIAVADKIKEDSKEAIQELKNMGIKTVMLTGDNKNTANAVKEKVGVDEVIAEVLPQEKEKVIQKLKQQGKTAMVGDGINDALALTSADIGIAISSGTDVAIDAADIVLVKNKLTDVTAAIRLSRQTLKNIKENLFWAFIYNIIGIPVAAGVLIPICGLKLNPMIGALAMSMSSVCVVTNALRLNLFNIKSSAKDNKIRKNKKEKKTMEKIIKIEGMMCGHCEARVKKCLEEIDGVTEAIVSHEDKKATVKLSKDVPVEVLEKAVKDQGYEIIH